MTSRPAFFMMEAMTIPLVIAAAVSASTVLGAFVVPPLFAFAHIAAMIGAPAAIPFVAVVHLLAAVAS